jgi:pimeloyl-ACP methyl ester carboxylesterase
VTSGPGSPALLRPPDGRAAWREARAFLELPGLLLRAPSLSRAPRGDGGPVMVLPGYGTGDGATAILRAYLSRLGHDVRPWGLGRNDGDVPALLPRVVERVAALAQETGRPVRLVGWSLGGYLAREASRDLPDAVDRVITLGTPVVGGPRYTLAARAYRRRGDDLDAIEAAVASRDDVPLTRPVLALYSRRDGIVSWQACIDRRNACVEHVEVETSHLGFVLSATVLLLLATRLAAAAR